MLKRPLLPSQITKLTVTILISLPLTNIQAHEVWVSNHYTHTDEVLKTNLGYGDFPALSEIAEDRLHIFSQPMQLLSAKGKEDLTQVGKHNYEYQSKAALEAGTYLVTAEYQPTFWSKNEDGWAQVNMTDMPDASYCEQTRMYAKGVLNVGHDSNDDEFVSKPIGQGLEIVPLGNPANAKVGEVFPLKILFNGEPLEGETVVATFKSFAPKDADDHYHKLEAQAFSDSTYPDGTVKFLPWKEGQWKVRVVHKTDYPNAQECQTLASYATLTFDIGTTEQIHAMHADDGKQMTHAHQH